MIVQTFRVLLIEDEFVTAKVTERILIRSSGGRFSVTHKAKLADAIHALTMDDFDVLLLDLNLPDSQGLDTLTKITDVAPEVATIVLTAADDDELGVRAVQLGAQDFLVKGSFNDAFLQRSILYSVERHRLQRTVRQLAIIDELTGLYNRRGFNSLHPDIMARAKRGDARGYLVYMDLDRFKQINDQLGHAKGDEALAEFAVNLREIFRKDALLVRMGGDEFLAMGVESRPGQVDDTLQALDVVLSVRNMRDNIEYQLESSRGVAFFGQGRPVTSEELLAAADTALYENKQERKRGGGAKPAFPFSISA